MQMGFYASHEGLGGCQAVIGACQLGCKELSIVSLVHGQTRQAERIACASGPADEVLMW